MKDRFQRLSTMAEERKVNLFYLKDTILNKEASLHDKFEAIAQIRKNVGLPVFKFAIESVLTKFHSIAELSLQIELINIIGKSKQPDLLRGLQKLLVCDVKSLHADVAEEIEDAICELKTATKLQTSSSKAQLVPSSKGHMRARNISGSGQPLGSLGQAPTPGHRPVQHS